MEPPEDMEGRTFVEVMSEKYSPENFPYRRGPGMGVVVVPTAGSQGSPMKGELEVNNDWPRSTNRWIYGHVFFIAFITASAEWAKVCYMVLYIQYG